MLYLACNDGGGVVKVVEANDFDEAYEDTIRMNKGVFLVELDDETIEILKEKMTLGEKKKYKITARMIVEEIVEAKRREKAIAEWNRGTLLTQRPNEEVSDEIEVRESEILSVEVVE